MLKFSVDLQVRVPGQGSDGVVMWTGPLVACDNGGDATMGPCREGPKDCSDGIAIQDGVAKFVGCGQGGHVEDFAYQFEVERGLEWETCDWYNVFVFLLP